MSWWQVDLRQRAGSIVHTFLSTSSLWAHTWKIAALQLHWEVTDIQRAGPRLTTKSIPTLLNQRDWFTKSRWTHLTWQAAIINTVLGARDENHWGWVQKPFSKTFKIPVSTLTHSLNPFLSSFYFVLSLCSLLGGGVLLDLNLLGSEFLRDDMQLQR